MKRDLTFPGLLALLFLFTLSSNAQSVVINELMASNDATAADQDGEFDDWIELFNAGSESIDISGWYLSDNPDNLGKWQFPEGTMIGGNGYLIVWADEDGSQEGLHANFKLSATSGEVVYLLDSTLQLLQEVVFGVQETDKSYARIPNGVGAFEIAPPSFGYNNDLRVSVGDVEREADFELFPNPANDELTVQFAQSKGARLLEVFDGVGQLMYRATVEGPHRVGVNQWAEGMYVMRVGETVRKFVVR